MFLVWGVGGESSAYVPGAIRSKRRVKRADAARATDRIGANAGDAHDGIETPDERSRAQRAYHQAAQVAPERQPAILARQIHNAPVVSLAPTASVAEAWELFRVRRFRHVPVLNGSGRIVGILSDRDVLRATKNPFLSSPTESLSSETQVQHVMTADVLTAHPDTSIRDIARVFFEERIGAVPIVDRGEALVGIVTRSDILRTVLSSAPLELWA